MPPSNSKRTSRRGEQSTAQDSSNSFHGFGQGCDVPPKRERKGKGKAKARDSEKEDEISDNEEEDTKAPNEKSEIKRKGKRKKKIPQEPGTLLMERKQSQEREEEESNNTLSNGNQLRNPSTRTHPGIFLPGVRDARAEKMRLKRRQEIERMGPLIIKKEEDESDSSHMIKGTKSAPNQSSFSLSKSSRDFRDDRCEDESMEVYEDDLRRKRGKGRWKESSIANGMVERGLDASDGDGEGSETEIEKVEVEDEEYASTNNEEEEKVFQISSHPSFDRSVMKHSSARSEFLIDHLPCSFGVYNSHSKLFEKWTDLRGGNRDQLSSKINQNGYGSESDEREVTMSLVLVEVKSLAAGVNVKKVVKFFWILIHDEMNGSILLKTPIHRDGKWNLHAHSELSVTFGWRGGLRYPSGERDLHPRDYHMIILLGDDPAFDKVFEKIGEIVEEALADDEHIETTSYENGSSGRRATRREGLEDEDDGEENEVSSEDDDEEKDRDDAFQGIRGNLQNALLETGYKGHIYVTRGDKIGVFGRNERDRGLLFENNIDIRWEDFKKGRTKWCFDPSQIMLHMQDTKLLFNSTTHRNSLQLLDIETGKLANHFRLDPTRGIVKSFCPEMKYSQQHSNQVFRTITETALLAIDPRIPNGNCNNSSSDNIVNGHRSRSYASKQRFSAMATTSTGDIAVATEKGEIKLFDKNVCQTSRAKTSLSVGLGTGVSGKGEVRGLDVTGDGTHVVMTTKDRLLFLKTEITEGPNRRRTGFQFNIPKSNNTIPMTLTIPPKRLQGNNSEISFTRAKFNTCSHGAIESSIITSTNDQVVCWKMRHLALGNARAYVRSYDSPVVADDFSFGNDREIIVTMPTKVRTEMSDNLHVAKQ